MFYVDVLRVSLNNLRTKSTKLRRTVFRRRRKFVDSVSTLIFRRFFKFGDDLSSSKQTKPNRGYRLKFEFLSFSKEIWLLA